MKEPNPDAPKLLKDAIDIFLEYLGRQRQFTPKSVYNHGLYLRRSELELRPVTLLKVERGSQIEAAVWAASKHRKMKWNGGNMKDEGKGWRNRCAGKIVNFYEWAYRERLIERNPYPENTFPAPYRPRAGWLPEERLDILFRCDRLAERDKMMVRFFYDTGFRISEAVTVKVESIECEEVVDEQGDTKLMYYATAWSKKEHRFKRQPISNTTVYWIEIILGYRYFKSEWLFCNPETGEQATEHSLRERFRKISATMGFVVNGDTIPENQEWRIHAHKMRHTIGTHLTKHLGMDKACEHLGHSTLDMTRHYYHSTGGERHQNLERLAEKIGATKKVFLGP